MSVLVSFADRLRKFSRFAIRHYYSSIEITGRERIPATGPVVFVANHPNSMFDPAIVGITAVRPVHFVSKAPLFDLPVFGDFMRALGMIPAFRGRDDMAQVPRNTGSLDDAAQWLIRGDAVGIFPEGVSHDHPRLELVRGGAARMALAAARAGAPVRIVPLGLNYECKEKFKSAIWVRVGEPIDVQTQFPNLADDSRRTARELTNEIDRRLKSVAVHVNEEKWESSLPDLEVLLPAPSEFAEVPAASLRQRKRIADAINYFAEHDRLRAEAMAAAIQKHRELLASEHMQLRSDVINLHGHKLTAKIGRQIIWFIFLFPPALAGLLHHAIPILLMRGIIAVIPLSDRSTLGLIRLLFALPILPIWYAFVWWWLARWTQPWIATLWTALMPLAGLRALFFYRALRTTIPALWHECRLLLRPKRLHALRHAHIELRHQLRLFAADYGKVFERSESYRD